jgi:leucyl-tRNA synthetase
VTADYEAFRFNTMVAKLMELTNTLFRYRGTPVAGGPAWDEALRLLLLMLAPAAPHLAEELWSRRQAEAGQPWRSIHLETWPEVDLAATTESTREVPVQVNGKLRDKIVVAADADQASIEAAALAAPRIAAILAGRTPDKVIAPGGGKLVNIVLRDA